MGNKPNLERLLDGDFDDWVPPHIKQEGIDTAAINAFIHFSGNAEIMTRLYQGMDSGTEDALWGTVDFLVTQARQERYAKLRADIWRQREAIKAAKKEIFPDGLAAAVKDVYVTYLIKQGLPAGKANSFARIALAYVDTNFLAWPSGHSIHEVKPKGFGPYALLVYPIRRAVRFFMLRGANADSFYNWTTGPTGPAGS